MSGNSGSNGKDPEFGAKLDALARAIGHLLEASKFDSVSIGEALGVDKARVSDMRRGTVHVRPHHHARLIRHYQLQGKLDPKTFTLRLNEFEAELRRLGLGVHGGGEIAAARQTLFDLSDPARPTGGRCSVEIFNVLDSRRAGGLGLPPEARVAPPQFRQGDRVRVRVTVPEPGHLVLLDEQIPVEITCLMPSMFAPHTEISQRCYLLPSTSGDPLTGAFHVSHPQGLHRLFAVWTRSPPSLSWVLEDPLDLPPPIVPDDDVIAFVRDVSAIAHTYPEALAIATADYRVI